MRVGATTGASRGRQEGAMNEIVARMSDSWGFEKVRQWIWAAFRTKGRVTPLHSLQWGVSDDYLADLRKFF